MSCLDPPDSPTLINLTPLSFKSPLPSPSTPTSPTIQSAKVLNWNTISPNVKQTEYAVRGELAIRAEQLREQLQQQQQQQHINANSNSILPFSHIINCNIGNPQQLNQPPISFLRQVASLLEYPPLLDPRNHDIVHKLFPNDAIERARSMANDIGSVGSYSHSQGIPSIRKNVANFIQQRDGFPSDPNKIFLTAGASPGVNMIMQTIIANDDVGILVPIPQYPLYTATIGLFNGKVIPYYLDEPNGWTIDSNDIITAINKSRQHGIDVRALCVINPGNPTGNILSRNDMINLIKICVNERLILLADEVYQMNVYDKERKPWLSFKQVVCELGITENDIELVSFHSISKGILGECGRRGGYFEVFGIDPVICDQLYKLASISLCPNVSGQIGVDIMVNPPKPGDESYPTYNTEITHLHESLKRRSKKLYNALNLLEGVTCQPAEGSMYLHPRIELPPNAIIAAQKENKPADTFYVMALLNATGVCMVPGSGFLQVPGTYHFRCTFLPPEDQLDEFITKVGTFHKQFMDKYRD